LKYYCANNLKYLTDRCNDWVLKLINWGLINHVHVLVLRKVSESETITKKVYYYQNEFSSIQTFIKLLKYCLSLWSSCTVSKPFLIFYLILFFFTILFFKKEKSLNWNYKAHYSKDKKYILRIFLTCKNTSQARAYYAS
jgi:hypothetical protein